METIMQISNLLLQIANLILQFAKIVISWPLAVFVLGLLFIRTFREPISDFFRRIIRGEAYGVRIEAATPSEQRKEAQQSESFRTPDEVERYVKENPKQVITEYQRLLNGYWFERAYNLIYGTQMALLQYLQVKGTEGEKYVNLFRFYNDFVFRSKLQKTQFADYLGFLAEIRFIEYKGQDTDLTVHITPYGINFLSYIQAQYPTSYRYRPF